MRLCVPERVAARIEERALYRAWGRVGLSAFGPARRGRDIDSNRPRLGRLQPVAHDAAFAKMDGSDRPGRGQAGDQPAGADRERSRLCPHAATDALTKGGKDTSQPWENPDTGARGSVTPLSQAYSPRTAAPAGISWQATSTARRKLAAGRRLQGRQGRWEIHTLKPWRRDRRVERLCKRRPPRQLQKCHWLPR